MSNTLEDRIIKLENKMSKIEKRNNRVEVDKSWETSIARKIIIALLTYATLAIVMMSFAFPKPILNAIIPTIGFVLSSLSLPLFKKIWLERNNNSRTFTEQ